MGVCLIDRTWCIPITSGADNELSIRQSISTHPPVWEYKDLHGWLKKIKVEVDHIRLTFLLSIWSYTR